MTRINTNVSSLIAQKTLSRSNADLQVSLTRLSTGLRINTGKDDPAGLIASENLRRDITTIGKAISNSERANQLIATADSALGQVSSLLNDIRGLVTEAANSGALSEEQISANQLQVDSSLEAIDRIAQVTTFQGRKILDGSLSFLTTAGDGFTTAKHLQIDQANLGSAGELAVEVKISTAATQAEITNDGIDFTAGNVATGTLTFTDITTPAVQATDDIANGNLADKANVAGGLTVVANSAFDGDAGNSLQIVFEEDDQVTTHSASLSGNTLTITVGTSDGSGGEEATIALKDIFDGLAADTDFTDNLTHDITAGDYTVNTDDGETIDFTGGDDAVTANDVITVTAAQAGTAFNGNITVASTGGAGTGIVAAYSGGNITVTIENGATVDIADIATEIDGLADFSASVTTANADGEFDAGTDTNPTGTLAGGTEDSGDGLAASLVVEISGKVGSEVFNFESGTTLAQVVDAINLVSDATGVEAENDGGELRLFSTAYGTSAFVDVNVITEGDGGEFNDALSASRATGDDIAATVNGVTASGEGNSLSINTATLDLKLTVDDGSDEDVSFTITGGGALFQLGPDVVSNQQARLGIQSVNTARLGGAAGKLYELRSGGTASLTNHASKAAEIVDEVINQVTSLRGRLGAFQKTTIDTNIFTLNDTLANLTEAESSIRDADFAAESARLTRAQILVQSGTSVLAIANSNPQNVLALLR